MIILTERLQAMANNIEPGESFADIGTDHGYLPLYFLEKSQGDRGKIIMADVSKGSLQKAEENFERLFPLEYKAYISSKNKSKKGSSGVDLRLGDGLDVLFPGEVDTVVMAGIGGLLTVEIMDWDISKTLSYKKFILQPRNNGGALRRYLFEQGFSLEKLLIVPEDRRFCEIMVCKSPKSYEGRKDSSEIDDLEFEYPESLRNIIKDPAMSSSLKKNTRDYLENAIKVENQIIDKITAGRIEKGNDGELEDDAIQIRKRRIARIMDILA